MPVLHNRYRYVKISRPSGTKTAEGQTQFYAEDGYLTPRVVAVEHAFARAWRNFIREHGYTPDSDVVVFEGTVSHGMVSFTILVLPE